MKIRGEVLRANDYGLYVIRDMNSDRQYVFTADKLDSFRGESREELGVHRGSVVTVTIENDKVVAATKG
jgi:hypothetical protein